jgi:CubicO group peptidase (beta-lactamase class C family)
VQLKTYGERSPGQPMTRDTIFRIYSMTKPITGTAMMILFEENRWKLDDPVTRFIPEFADLKVVTGVDASGNPVLVPARRPPTMREVMSHTAGFAYATDPKDPADKIFIDKGVMQADGLKQMIQRLAQTPLIFQPGDRWWYSAAVDVQGYLVESISGMKFSEFLRTRVFEPLKMADTGFWVPPEKVARLSTVWEDDQKARTLHPMKIRNGAPLPDATKPPALESGGGGLFSTVDDYARFAQMINNKGELDGVRILSPAAVELMGHNVVSQSALAQRTYFNSFHETVGFGLDFMVVMDPREAGRLEGKGTMSWEGAAGTWFWTDPANGVVLVGMVQNFAYTGPRGSGAGRSEPLARF